MSVVTTEQTSRSGINRQFWNYVIPTVGAMLVSALYQAIDGIFIGRYIGAEGLAGINMVWPIIGTLYGFGMMIGVGSGAISSISRGEKNLPRARQALGNGVMLLFTAGVISAVLLIDLGPLALDLQTADGQALAFANDYLDIFIIYAPVSIGSMALPFMLRNDESPGTATWLIVIGSILNIILDAVFIAWLDMGLTGAALGTALSQLLVVVLGCIYFFSARANTRLTMRDLIPDFALSGQIFAIGLSSLLMYSYFSFITAVHNYLFLQYGSATTVGAFAIVSYIGTLYYMFAEGVAQGAQPLISYHYGAHDFTLMKHYILKMIWVTVGSGVLLTVVINLFSSPLIHLFNGEDHALFTATQTGLELHLFAMALDGLIFSVGVFFQSLGLSRKASFISMANMMVQLPFLLLLPQIIGKSGVWLSVPLSNIALSFVVLWMIRQEWKNLDRQADKTEEENNFSQAA